MEHDPRSSRRRAVLMVGGIGAVAFVLPGLMLVVLLGIADDPLPPPDREVQPVGPSPPAAAVDRAGGGHADGSLPSGAAVGEEWDVAAQTELATRPMLQLPEAAALPHELTDDVAGPPITLPPPGVTAAVVPMGFPPTVEGAVAQLAALTRVGLEGGDPAGYRLAYESLTLPGAPAVEDARLYRDLRRVRAGVVGLPATGAVVGMTFTWTPTSALVKGVSDGDRFAVVCVLGELVAGINGQAIASGAGDCQAFRWVGDQWWISPGAAAAPATLAWPGSAEAARAGYRAVRS
jgi:hypothetical protein